MSENSLASLSRRDSSRTHSRRSVDLDECQKSWMLLSADCHLQGLKTLHRINHHIINDKSFLTGYTALHWAAKKGRMDMLNWLCDNGANINAISHGGYSPMHIAAMHSNARVIDVLYQTYGGSIDIRDNSGRKPSWYMPAHPLWCTSVSVSPDARNSSSSSASSSDAFVNISSTMHVAADHSRHNGAERMLRHDDSDQKEGGMRRTMLSVAKSFRSKDRRRRKQPVEAKESKGGLRMRANTDIVAIASPRQQPRGLSTPKARHLSIEHPHLQERDEPLGQQPTPSYTSNLLGSRNRITENGEGGNRAKKDDLPSNGSNASNDGAHKRPPPVANEARHGGSESTNGHRSINNNHDWRNHPHHYGNNNANEPAEKRIANAKRTHQQQAAKSGSIDHCSLPDPKRDWKSTTFV